MSNTSNTSPGISIGPDQKVKIPLGYLLSGLGILVSCTVTVSVFLVNTKNETQQSIKDIGVKLEVSQDKMQEQIQSLRKEVQEQGKRAWLWDEQTRWVGQLRWEFRKSEYIIPDPRDFRTAP